MSLLYCTSCGHGLVLDAGFCENCGQAQAPNKPPYPLPADAPSKSARLGVFFASQANLSLVTLLVFFGLLIALAPVGWSYARMQVRSHGDPAKDATADTRSIGATASPARCNQIVVLFSNNASMTQVSSLLDQLDTTIVFGPNENGAFELSVLPASAAGVTDALNRAEDTVISASLQRRCI